MTFLRCATFVGALASVPGFALAQAQATVKPDGQFRYALGAGASYSSGNTDSSSVNLSGDVVRATGGSKLQFGGKALWSRSDGVTSAENAALVGEYDRDFTPLWFSFTKADLTRDKLANLAWRASLFGGVGRHVYRTDALTWDVSAGLGYTEDRYVESADVDGGFRNRLGRAEALFAEESNHKWTPTTSFHQKLSLFPALRSGGGYRGVFDTGLAVSMTQALSLTAGLNYRYNSDPGSGLKNADTVFITGIAVKLD